MICGPCPAGARVRARCNGTVSRTCVDCPPETFSEYPNHKDSCQRCRRCGRKELKVHPCTKTSNTECGCRSGYIYRPTKPCYKCPNGLVAKNNMCTNTTITPPNPNIETKGSDIVVIALASGVLVIILIVIVLLIWCYRRRGPRQDAQHGLENTPDVLNGVLKNTKTPPLPPKMSRRRNENVYGPDPQQQACRPLVEKKIVSRQLPFSLVHDMNLMLSTSHEKNYKHLAGELGYSYAFVKALDSKSQPLETLMDDYMSGPNPTKEKLHEALVAIHRNDVAKMVWDEL